MVLKRHVSRNYSRGGLAANHPMFRPGDVKWSYEMGNIRGRTKINRRHILGTCPGGDGPIVAGFYTKTDLWAHCECLTRWWFRYPLKKPKRKPKKKPEKVLTTEKMEHEISAEELKNGHFLTGKPSVTWSSGGKPRCPNHNEPFEVSYLELKEGKGRGQCPVSKAFFMFEVDPEMEQVDKFGNRTKAFRITGNEN